MSRPRDPRLSLDQRKLIAKSRTIGSGTGAIRLEDKSLVKIVGMIERDLDRSGELECLPARSRPAAGYYDLPVTWFASKGGAADFVALFLEANAKIENFQTIFECMCEIHKRRVKFRRIMQGQALPSIDEIAHRALLEAGMMGDPELASFLIWRKWLYDIDNRAGQETGNLFVPIVARALGGRSVSAKASPIRRDDNHTRRVDCIVDRRAYDFKARLTDAPSRRARFADEKAFARDCRVSGYVPVLLALHHDPCEKTSELIEAYERNGGEVYLGHAAWDHLQNEAGPNMGVFLEKYLRRSLVSVSAAFDELLDVKLHRGQTQMEITVGGQAKSRMVVARA